MKINYIYFLVLNIMLLIFRANQKISFLKKNRLSNENYFGLTEGQPNIIKDKPPQCNLNKIDYTGQFQTSYSQFFKDVHSLTTRLSVFEIKNLFKFLDNKSAGQFDNKRWTDFNYLFLSKFINCDVDTDCLLNQKELTTCFLNNDMKAAIQDLPKSFSAANLISDIIFSFDYDRKGGINLSQYIFLKKIITGFNQYNVIGVLERDTFFSALKTTFSDFLLDELDAHMAYRISLNLMIHDGTYKIYFPTYLEICRLINSYYGYGVSIGEGFITKDQIIRNFENIVYPSKLNKSFLKKYFAIFDEDIEKESTINFDPSSSAIITRNDENSLRFEDYANLEFWANIFTNYTINLNLNVTGFTNLMTTNKYINPIFLVYIGSSNFEDLSNINIQPNVSSSLRDIDFLNGYSMSFLETEIKIKKEFSIKKFKDKSNSKEKLTSLFELNLGDHLENESEKSKGKVSSKQTSDAMGYYFQILDTNNDGNLSFDELISFIKFLKIFHILNKDNDDIRGIITSSKVNLINQIVINPKLSLNENTRLQTFDTLTCNYVDFLLFFDFMYAPKIFKLYFISPNEPIVEEINMLMIMNILNIHTEFQSNKFQMLPGPKSSMGSYDYEPILKVGLENKCMSNQNIYANNKPLVGAKSPGIKDPLSQAVLNGGGMDLRNN